MEAPRIRKSRASTSDEARRYRQQGHDDALGFATAIGLNEDYRNDVKAKKDVIDPSGDAHSVKSGEKKWQIFLYGEERFKNDEGFLFRGVGQLLLDCINCFPATYNEYVFDKVTAKQKLRSQMMKLKDILQDKMALRAFLAKAFFNGNEVNYLTVKHNGIFHVFSAKQVIEVLSEIIEVANSQARQAGQTPEQKVVLRYDGTTLGEVEMRNDSDIHYREIRFNIIKPKIMKALFEHIMLMVHYTDTVWVYGSAAKTFGRWAKR